MRSIVYIIESRVLRCGTDVYVPDSNYLENLRLFSHYFDEVVLCASVENCDKLNRVCERLPNKVKLIQAKNSTFFNRKLSIVQLLTSTNSNFYYTDDFFIPIFIKVFKSKSKIFLEMRNYSLLNFSYNVKRFNFFGIFLTFFSNFIIVFLSRVIDGLVVLDLLPNHLSFLYRNKFVLLPDYYDSFNEGTIRNVASDELNLLFVGNLEKVKRVDWIIKLLADLKRDYSNISLRIVGAGPELAYLQSLTISLGVSDNVKFIGPVVSISLLNNIYSTSTVLLVTSFSETGPRIIPEALKNSCQVFSINTGFYSKLLDSRCISRSKYYQGFKIDFVNFWKLDHEQKIMIHKNNLRNLDNFSGLNNLRRRNFVYKYLFAK